MAQNSFDFQRIAQGYKDRPFLHKQVIERFQRVVTDRKFARGLDAGCGAGLSSRALKMICSHVTGADISAEMVKAAVEICGDGEGYDFIVSKAEEIPSVEGGYDIVSAAGAVQWIAMGAFLQNLREIMCKDGYVLVYDFGISDRMKGKESYTGWWHEAYLKEFPKPFRNEHVWTAEEVKPYGFFMLGQERYEMEHEFDRDSFIRFMMLQSNVNVKIEGEGRDEEEVRKWFEKSLAPVFGKEKERLIFNGYSWYMKLEAAGLWKGVDMDSFLDGKRDGAVSDGTDFG